MLRRRLCLLRAYRCRLDDLVWRTASSEKEGRSILSLFAFRVSNRFYFWNLFGEKQAGQV
jgi:hypothetical protein